MQSTICSVVERRAFADLTDEDMPVAVLREPQRCRDLIRALQWLSVPQRALSAASFELDNWVAYCADGRFILCPAQDGQPIEAALLRRLPHEWKMCLRA